MNARGRKRIKDGVACIIGALAMAAALLLPLALGACDRHPCQGTVIGKRYSPPYEYVDLQPMYHGKNTLYIPVTRHVPASYSVDIRYPDGKSGTWNFPSFDYQRAVIGAQWPPVPANQTLEAP